MLANLNQSCSEGEMNGMHHCTTDVSTLLISEMIVTVQWCFVLGRWGWLMLEDYFAVFTDKRVARRQAVGGSVRALHSYYRV